MKANIRSIARIAAIAASATFATAAPRRALAGEVSVRVSVKRTADTADCTDAAGLAAAIARAGNRSLPATAADADARLRFDVDLSRNSTGYLATVRIMGARIGVREIAHVGSTCAPLVDALVVSLMVVIDDVEEADAAPPPPPEHPKTSGVMVPPPPLKRENTYRRDPVVEGTEVVSARNASSSFFLELGGNGIFYTLNYEHIFGDSNISLRAGFGYIHLNGRLAGHFFNEEDISVPAIANYYLGGRDHKLQLGAGATILYRQGDQGSNQGTNTALLGTLVIGYRYLPRDGGLDFGVAFTPCFGSGLGLPWGGVNFGVGF
jgi:hypothetical protein